ncbi:hypothetical protein ACH4OW_23805 [Streptomyces sp. NPDC017056]|uniref:hypothetical protein n=1 Tax=Streptomyces sp. NPDC017056 TaxID=3364973 RepID=UPI00379A8A05
MPKTLSGTAPLIISPFRHRFDPAEFCLLAYSSYELRGVVGVLPDEKGDTPSLWDMAGRNLPRNILPTSEAEEYGRWLLNCASALRLLTPPDAIRVSGQRWDLDLQRTVDRFKPHQYGETVYGWYGVHVGILSLGDEGKAITKHALAALQARRR